MISEQDQDREVETSPYANSTYRWYVLGLLTLVYTFNFVDRQVLVILQEQIRAELGLMDWQLGMLSGFAFAIFYATLGMPIAQYSETLGRKRVVAVALATWSAMTAISGAAQNFAHLLLARVGVGVGEAGGSPPSHSMISDIFPQKSRALALGIYSMGIYFGVMVGFSIGGWVAQDFGWRTTFVVVGLPGVLLAVIVGLTIKEPARAIGDRLEQAAEGLAIPADNPERPRFSETIALLWSRKSFRHLSLACALHAFTQYGISNFMPPFMARAHDMPVSDIGWRLALIAGIGGAIGSVLGGWLADRLGKRDRRWYVGVATVSLMLILPLVPIALMAESQFIFLLFLAPVVALGGVYLGPCLAVTHSMVGLRQRAVASAILFFILNLIGLGFGPMTIGAISDLLRPEFGDSDGLRYAIIGAASIANAWAILHYLLASRTLREDIAAAEREQATAR